GDRSRRPAPQGSASTPRRSRQAPPRKAPPARRWCDGRQCRATAWRHGPGSFVPRLAAVRFDDACGPLALGVGGDLLGPAAAEGDAVGFRLALLFGAGLLLAGAAEVDDLGGHFMSSQQEI